MKKRFKFTSLILTLCILLASATVYADGIPTVDFTGREHKFVFTPESTDLFANFKGVMPGDSLDQQILVRNSSDMNVEIYMRAEAVGTDDVEFLSYFTLNVRNADSAIFNAPANEQEDLAENVLLGELASGAQLTLDVHLNASLVLGNEFQNYDGKIIWIFTVKEVEEVTPPPSESPTPPESPTPTVPPTPSESPIASDEPTATPTDSPEPTNPPLPVTGTSAYAGFGFTVVILGVVVMMIVLGKRRKSNSENG